MRPGRQSATRTVEVESFGLAVTAARPLGTVHRLDAAVGPLRAELWRTSTHAFGLAEAVVSSQWQR
jgi:hypothetical protein